MPITELLITGYDGEEAVFAVNLAPESASIALTRKDDSGDTVVNSMWNRNSQAFAAIRQLVEDLAAPPVLQIQR